MATSADFLLLLFILIACCFNQLHAQRWGGAKPGCPEKCGNVNISYPFGIGEGCFHEGFEISCSNDSNQSYPIPLLGEIPILDILQDQIRINTSEALAIDCRDDSIRYSAYVYLPDGDPFTISGRSNRFIAMGCDTQAYITDNKTFTSGCISQCNSRESVQSHSGVGYCETSIPDGIRSFHFNVSNFNNYDKTLAFSNCSYSFLVESRFNVNESMLQSFRSSADLPLMVDWAIGNTTKCPNAASSAACRANRVCVESPRGFGYLCNCSEGYEGNPYLDGPSGCQDIDECNKDPCAPPAICKNSEPGFSCLCPDDYNYVDGRQETTRCISKHNFSMIQVVLGVGLSFLFLIATGSWVYWALKKRRLIKRKEEFFIQNGGLFLKRRLGFGQGSGGGAIEFMKIFTEEELKKATNNYHESGILGRGGYGTVYKGFLEDQRTVAIKRSKIIDESQKEQFINEVFILAQTDHRNIVKLLGCCLETQVPLLVYEFISNGTLFHHLHERGPAAARLTWDNRLRIAIETAEALAYLHSAPIIHRDVKSANILLDQNYTTKVADFGVSRLVPVNQSQVLTYVQGTFGYMDPEYFHTSQFTAKSDVYSFGVVLVELITGEKAVTQERSQSGTNLAIHFIRSMEEDRLRDVLEDEVFEEVSMAVFHRVAELAVKCLQLKGGKRPTMKEVEEELKGLRGTNVHAWLQQNDEDETEHLLGDVQGMNSFHETGTSQDSLQINNSILSIELGR